MKSEEAQRLLCYTDKKSFWDFVHAQGVPCVRLNARRILFDRAAVEAWLGRRTIGKGASL